MVIYDVYAETGRVRALWMGAGDLRRRAEGYPERALADYLAAGVDDADGVLEESWTLKYIAYLGPQMSPFPAEEKVARWREEMQKRARLCAYMGMDGVRRAYNALAVLAGTPPVGVSFRHAQRTSTPG